MTKDVCTLETPRIGFCCIKCSFSDPERNEKIRRGQLGLTDAERTEKQLRRRATLKARYGSETFNNHEKGVETLKRKYGENVINPGQLESSKQKSKETQLKRYGATSFTKTEEFRRKTRKTSLERYGYESPNMSPEVKAKTQRTCQERYGGNGPMSDLEVRKKSEATVVERYGVRYVSQCPEIVERQKRGYMRTRRLKYGGLHPVQTKEIKEKISASCSTDEYFMKMEKSHLEKFLYDGIKFDSAPELAAYVYFRDNGIKFEYHPKPALTYDFGGMKHRYYPDFRVFYTSGSRLIEIKGDHFFREDGTMYCPYRNQAWSDKRYEFECEKFEAKHQCMLVNKVRIERNAQYARYIGYVRRKYGKRFFAEHKARRGK